MPMNTLLLQIIFISVLGRFFYQCLSIFERRGGVNLTLGVVYGTGVYKGFSPAKISSHSSFNRSVAESTAIT